MGTRGLTVVKKNGVVKVAQYGQWDHYPTGQGCNICGYFRDDGSFLKALAQNVDYCEFVKQKEIDQFYAILSTEKASGNRLINLMFGLSHFCRDCGSKVLYTIANEHLSDFKKMLLVDELPFWEDTLFCEWVHELDITQKSTDGLCKTDCRYNIYHGKKLVASFDMVNGVPTDEDLQKVEDAEKEEDEE